MIDGKIKKNKNFENLVINNIKIIQKFNFNHNFVVQFSSKTTVSNHYFQ